MKAFLAAIVIGSGLLGASLSLAHDHGPHAKAHMVFEKVGVHAHLSWEQEPSMSGQEAVLKMHWMDAKSHAPVSLSAVPEVWLWMPDMGHGGAPVVVEAVMDEQGHVQKGVYRVSQIFFFMPGIWEVKIAVKDSRGQKETKSMIIDVQGESVH